MDARAVDETGGQIAVFGRLGSRPFNRSEMEKLFLTSKGGAGATGGALVKLTASLQSTRVLPMGGVGLLFGIDRVLGVATSTTNVIGNTVATLVVSRWEGLFNREQFDAMLHERTQTSKPGLAASQRS